MSINDLLKNKSFIVLEDVKKLAKQHGSSQTTMEKIGPHGLFAWPHLKVQSSKDAELIKVKKYMEEETNLPLEFDESLLRKGVLIIRFNKEKVEDFLRAYTKIDDYVKPKNKQPEVVIQQESETTVGATGSIVDSRASLRKLLVQCGCKIVAIKNNSHIHTCKFDEKNENKVHLYHYDIEQANRTLQLLELIGCKVEPGSKTITSLDVIVQPNINYLTLYKDEFTKYFPAIGEMQAPQEEKQVPRPAVKEDPKKSPQLVALDALFQTLSDEEQNLFLSTHGSQIDEATIRHDERQKTTQEMTGKIEQEMVTMLRKTYTERQLCIFTKLGTNGLMAFKEISLTDFLQPKK